MICKKREERAITLIALVITIIVLLILAGVTIAMLTGENGILKQANEAKEKTEQAKIEEEEKLEEYNKYIAKEIYGAPIPEGFFYVEGTAQDGVVMKDKNGNEWVWIEVPKSVTQNSSTDNEIEAALQTYAIEYRQDGWSDSWYEGCGLTQQEYNSNKSKMLQSIKVNGGFWIGRYEVGSDTYVTSPDNGIRTPIIKQDKYPYNWLTCEQAQRLVNQLNSSDKNTTSLMYGIQWDLVCKYIEEKGAKTRSRN